MSCSIPDLNRCRRGERKPRSRLSHWLAPEQESAACPVHRRFCSERGVFSGVPCSSRRPRTVPVEGSPNGSSSCRWLNQWTTRALRTGRHRAPPWPSQTDQRAIVSARALSQLSPVGSDRVLTAPCSPTLRIADRETCPCRCMDTVATSPDRHLGCVEHESARSDCDDRQPTIARVVGASMMNDV